MLSCKVVEEASSVMYRPVGQLVHEAEPTTEYFPEEQTVQRGEAWLAAYFPASQLRQAERPAWAEEVEASSVMYRPAGQLVHEEEPAEEYLPEAQVSHDVLSWE